MNATKARKMTLKDAARLVAGKPQGIREEYAWYYLREMFPGASDEALATWAGKMERHIGGF